MSVVRIATRLFVKLPLIAILLLATCSIVLPITAWVLFGKRYEEWFMDIIIRLIDESK